MKKITLILFIVCVLVLLPLTLFANDVIYISDGSKVEGEITEVSDSSIIVENFIGKYTIQVEDISKIVFEDTSEETNPEYIEKRQLIKSQLKKLIENNPQIKLKIEGETEDEDVGEESAESGSETKEKINVSYDEYDMRDAYQKVDGINLKEYYYGFDTYKDVLYILVNNTYEWITGTIIDVDKLRVKIRTKKGIINIYDYDVITRILFDGKGGIPKNRTVIKNLIKYYIKNYYDKDIKYTELSENLTSRINLGVHFRFVGTVGAGLNFGVRLVKGLSIHLISSTDMSKWMLLDLGFEYRLGISFKRPLNTIPVSYPFYVSLRSGIYFNSDRYYGIPEHSGGVSVTAGLTLFFLSFDVNMRFEFIDTQFDAKADILLSLNFYFG